MVGAGSRRKQAVLGVVMAATLVAGCGGGSGGGSGAEQTATGPVPEPTEPVTISFSSWIGEEPGMQTLLKKFQEAHPNITVELQNVPAEQANQKLTTQIAAGNPPDVAYLDASTVASFASRSALVDLDNYASRSDVVDPADYVEAFATFTRFEDSMYGLPFDGESTAMFYRTDLFAAAGIAAPPTTWEEFEDAARALTKPAERQYGWAMFAPESAYYFYPWLWQAGGEVLAPDGETVLFDEGPARQAAEFYIGLTRYAAPDYLNSNSYDARLAFANGQVAMYPAGAWFAGVLSDEFPDLEGKWASAPLPEGPAGCATTIAGDALVIFDGSEQKDAAWKWIEFLSAPENMAAWTFDNPDGTLLPPRTSLLESPELTEKKPVLAGFADAMDCGVSNVVVHEEWPRIEEALDEELGRAMYGEQTASEALDAAAAEAESLLR
jgi:multiple sugar transport system substrate-binding protein